VVTEKELQNLLREHDRLVDVLQSLEDGYKSGRVSKTDYELIRMRCEKKLSELEKKLGMPRKVALARRERKAITPPKLVPKRRRPIYLTLSFWLVLVGLVGGVLATAGVFLPWVTYSEVIEDENVVVHETVSGFDFPKRFGPREFPSFKGVSFALLSALIGGSLILLGAIGSLLKVPTGAGIFAGGILAAIGGIWGLVELSKGFTSLVLVNPNISLSVGYGIYMGIAGAVLAIIGLLGLILKE
jgi:hypothetical protein